jgi:hypothetical protein
MAAILDTVTIPIIATGSVTGPASYVTGGFLVDLSASFSFLRFLSIYDEAGTTADDIEVILNQDTTGAFAPGKAVVKVMRDRFDKATIGNVSGQPSGVTVRASKFATGETPPSGHFHNIDHDHPSATSSAPVSGGGGVDAVALGSNIYTHVHSVDLDPFSGTTPAGGGHTHDRSFEYHHKHSFSVTETNATIVEYSAGTNLALNWRYFAVGD